MTFSIPIGSLTYELIDGPTLAPAHIDHGARTITLSNQLSPSHRAAVAAAAVAQAWCEAIQAYGAKLLSVWTEFKLDSEAILREEGELDAEEQAPWFNAFATLRRMGVRFDPTFVERVDAAVIGTRGTEIDPDFDLSDQFLDRDDAAEWENEDPNEDRDDPDFDHSDGLLEAEAGPGLDVASREALDPTIDLHTGRETDAPDTRPPQATVRRRASVDGLVADTAAWVAARDERLRARTEAVAADTMRLAIHSVAALDKIMGDVGLLSVLDNVRDFDADGIVDMAAVAGRRLGELSERASSTIGDLHRRAMRRRLGLGPPPRPGPDVGDHRSMGTRSSERRP